MLPYDLKIIPGERGQYTIEAIDSYKTINSKLLDLIIKILSNSNTFDTSLPDSCSIIIKKKGKIILSHPDISESIKCPEEIFKVFREIFPNQNNDDIQINLHVSHGSNWDTPNILDLQQEIDDRLLAHIHADEFGFESELEGNSGNKSLEYLHNFLDSRLYTVKNVWHLPYNIPLEVLTQLHQALNLERLFSNATHLKNELTTWYGLQDAPPLLMLGGWVGNPSGHAIYYEFKKDLNGILSMKLFNVGEGSIVINSGIKNHAIPVLEWKNISKKQFLTPEFSKLLRELRFELIHPHTGYSKQYNSKDIYIALKEFLNPKEEIYSFVKNNEIVTMTAQRAGMCSWKSLLAFLKTKMTEEEYKKFKCEIKLQSLLDNYQISLSEKPTSTEIIHWNLVNKSLKKLCRSYVKLNRDYNLSDNYLSITHLYLMKIATWRDQHAEALYMENIQPLILGFNTPANNSQQTWKEGDLKSLVPIVSGLSHPITSNEKFADIKSFCSSYSYSFNYENIIPTISEISTFIEKQWLSGIDLEANVQLTSIIDFLPWSIEFWTNESHRDDYKIKTEELISILSQLSILYVKTCITSSTIPMSPEKIICLLKIAFLQENLIPIICPEWPGKFFNFQKLYSEIKNQPTFLIFTKHHSEEYNYLQSLFPAESIRSLFPSYGWRGKSNDDFFSNGFYFRSRENREYGHNEFEGQEHPFTKIMQNDSEFITKMSLDIPGFVSLPQYKQDAHIFISHNLPTWLKDIRNSFIFTQALVTENFITSKIHNRAKNFELQIEVDERTSNESMISIKFTGNFNDFSRNFDHSGFADSFKAIYPISEHIFPNEIREEEEKQIAILNSKKFLKATPEQIEEFRIFKSSLLYFKNIGLYSILSYLEGNSQKFIDKEYQFYLDVLLFHQIENLAELLSSPFICNRFNSVLNNNIIIFYENQQIIELVYFIRLARHLNQFSTPNVPIICANANSFLSNLLNTCILTPKEKGLIYSELCASMHRNTNPSREEILHLALGSVYLKTHPLYDASNQYVEQDVAEALIVHAKSLLNLKTEELNIILKDMKLEEIDQEWNLIGVVYQTINGQYSYSPLSADFAFHNSQISLPPTLLAKQKFKKIFGDTKTGLQINNSTFSIVDKNGILYYVQLVDQKLIIDRVLEGAMFRLRDSDDFAMENSQSSQVTRNSISPFLSSFLENNFDIWQSMEPDISPTFFLTEPGTSNHKYYCQFQIEASANYPIKVLRYSDNAILGVASENFKDFEALNFVHEWYSPDNSKCVQIEFPRYLLSFTPKRVDEIDIWISDQFPGYNLKYNYRVKGFLAFKSYLVLENNKGHKKLLLPHYKFDDPIVKEVLQPRFVIDYQTNLAKNKPYFTFDILENDILSSKSRKANLYLSQIYLLIQNYTMAEERIKKFGPKLQRYDQSEIHLLTNISKANTITGNIEGNALGIQTYASYLVFRNNINFKLEEIPKISLLLKSNYLTYLNHLNNVNFCRLTRNEELFIIQNLELGETVQIGDTAITSRFDYLDSNSEITSKPNNFTDEYNENYNFSFDSLREVFYYSSQFEDDLSKKPLQSLTRIDLEKINITSWYQSIFTSDIQSLQTALIFLTYQPTDRKITAEENKLIKIYFLKTIINNIDNFEPIPKFDVPEEFYVWWNAVVNKAERLKKPFVKSNKSKPEFQITHPKKAIGEELQLRNSEILDYENISLVNNFNILIEENRDIWTIPSSQLPEGDLNNHIISIKTLQGEDLDNPSPLYQNEIQRLLRDFEIFNSRAKKIEYNIKNLDKLTEIQIVLNQFVQTNELEMTLLMERIYKISGQKNINTVQQIHQDLLNWGEMTRDITFHELCVSFAKQDTEFLKTRNPSLTTENIKHLYILLANYLYIGCQCQQAKRSLAHIELLSSLKNEDIDFMKETIQEFTNELLATPNYDPLKKPLYLVFEYYCNIILRANQTSLIDNFLNNPNKNIIQELIMASGKSKVLLPLLSLLVADGKNVSLMILPQGLHTSISNDTKDIHSNLYNLQLHTFEFDRNTKLDLIHLKNILDELKITIKNREVVSLQSKTVHCLVLKFVEETFKHFNHNTSSIPPEIMCLRDILVILFKGYPLADEADLMLNILHQVSFNMGKQIVINPIEIEVISILFRILFLDRELKSLCRMECDPNGNPNAPFFTENIYTDVVQKKLAEKFIDEIIEKEGFGQFLPTNIKSFFLNLNSVEKLVTIDYICRTKGREKSAQEFFDSQPEMIQEVLAMAGEEVSTIFKHSLGKPCDVKYGLDLDNNGQLAIPYSYAKVPCLGSEFSNAHVTANYTMQYYIKKGISKELLQTQLRQLQESALKEIKESGKQLSIKDTQAWKDYCSIKVRLNIPLFNLNEMQVNTLLNSINRNLYGRISLVQKFILPKISTSEQKISSNAINLVSFFRKFSGFTGTLWNSGSMHRNISAQQTPGTDALTISLLLKNSFDAVHVLSNENPELILRELFVYSNFDMLIDSGGYFKDFKNNEIAKFLQDLSRKAVVFYNSKSEQAVFNNSLESSFNETNLKLNERITYLDQAHCVGADIKQDSKAIGLLTIGPHIILRDLLQGVWRLRGLEKSQKINFIISKDVAKIIKHANNLPENNFLTFPDILKFAIKNQIHQQGSDNYKAFIAELEEINQKMLLDILLDPNSEPLTCTQAIKRLGSSWLKPAYASSSQLYGTIPIEDSSVNVKALLIQKTKAKIEASGGGISELLELKIISDKYDRILPPTLLTKLNEGDNTSEVEKQSFLETETQVQTDVLKQKYDYLGEIKENIYRIKIDHPEEFSPSLYSSDYRASLPIFPIEYYFAKNENLQQFSDVFEGISMTLNMLVFPRRDNLTQDDFQFFGKHRMFINYLLIENNNVTLITMNEAGIRIRAGYNNLFELNLGFVNSSGTLTSELFEKIVKVKFLKGISSFNAAQIAVLKKWFIEKGIQRMYELFTKQILKDQLLQTQEYENSSLQKAFSSLTSGILK